MNIPIPESLSFNHNFLNFVLKHCIYDTGFLRKIRPFFNPKILKLKEKIVLLELVYDYYDQFKQAPEDDFFIIFEEEKENISEALYTKCKRVIKNLKEIQSSNSDYILNNIQKALKHFAIEDAIIKAAQLAKAKQYEEAKGIFLKALREHDNIKPSFYTFYDDKSYIPKRIEGKIYKFKTLVKPVDDMIGGMNPSWVVTILGATKGGKCVKYDSPIIMSDGKIKTIQDIYNNLDTNVMTLNEITKSIEKAKISNHYYNGNKPCYKVTTRTGREIEVTDNHPFLTINGWIELKNLNIGDYIAVPKQINVFGKKVIPNYKVKLLAYLIAEGSLTGNSIDFTNGDYDILEDCGICIKKIGDKVSIFDHNRIGITKGNYKPTPTNTRKWLQSLGIEREKSIHKFIPDVIFTLTKRQISLFLSILFTCDGCIAKDGKKITISYCSSSKKLIKQVFHLLIRFGIIGKIRSKESVNSYEIIITEKRSLKIFLNEIGFQFHKANKAKKFSFWIDSKKDNQGLIDLFPPDYSNYIKEQLNEFIIANGKQNRKWWQQKSLRNLSTSLQRKNGLTKNTVKEIGYIIGNSNLILDAKSDILWDKIKSIEFIGEHPTYDLTISGTENFISSDMVIHNTKWLIELAIASQVQGLNCLFVSLEMNKEQLDDAFDQAIGFLGDKPGQKIETMEYKRNQWCKVKMEVPTIYDLEKVNKARKALRANGGTLVISDQTGAKFNYIHLESLIDEIEQTKGIVFDIIIVDYLGEMGKTEKGQNAKQRIAANISGMKAIGKEKNTIMVTAEQGNRQAMKSDTFHSEMVADAIEPIWVSDLVLAICQSDEEEKENLYRMFVAEYRHGEKHKIATLVRDLAIGQIALGEGKLKKKRKHNLIAGLEEY